MIEAACVCAEVFLFVCVIQQLGGLSGGVKHVVARLHRVLPRLQRQPDTCADARTQNHTSHITHRSSVHRSGSAVRWTEGWAGTDGISHAPGEDLHDCSDREKTLSHPGMSRDEMPLPTGRGSAFIFLVFRFSPLRRQSPCCMAAP